MDLGEALEAETLLSAGAHQQPLNGAFNLVCLTTHKYKDLLVGTYSIEAFSSSYGTSKTMGCCDLIQGPNATAFSRGRLGISFTYSDPYMFFKKFRLVSS
jgi:hypothetical protein